MIQLIKEGNKYFIRKGICRPNCVIDNLTMKDLIRLVELIIKEYVKKNKNKKR